MELSTSGRMIFTGISRSLWGELFFSLETDLLLALHSRCRWRLNSVLQATEQVMALLGIETGIDPPQI
jgi:hypothetical protein